MTDPVTKHLSQELRNLARLAAQWADVLDSEAERDSGEPGSGLAGPANKLPGRADPVQCATPAAAKSSSDPVPPAPNPSNASTNTVASSAVSAPVIFRCAMCGARTIWNVEGWAKPWPGALCENCYAELRMRRDEIQDQALGYTGVR